MAKRKPPKLTGDAYDRRKAELAAMVEADLDELTDSAVAALAKLTAKPPPKNAAELMFEVYDPHPCPTVVYRLLGAGGFLEQIRYGHVLKDELLGRMNGLSAADAEIAISWNLAKEGLFCRFAAWWAAAGGDRYPLPVSLAEHDGGEGRPLAWGGA